MESETGIPHEEAANDMLQSAAPRGKCEDCETQPKQSFCQPPSHPLSPLVSRLVFVFFFTSGIINYQSSEPQQVEICESATPRTWKVGLCVKL